MLAVNGPRKKRRRGVMEHEAGWLGDRQLGDTIGSRRRKRSISDDYSVQKTNEDVTECKHTAAKLGYFKDAYVHSFVTGSDSAPRRDPEISRGYWARVTAIRVVINAFVQKFGEKAQIVSLGAGFDTLYWRLKEERKKFGKFVEIDFSSVTAKKIRLICKSGAQNLVEMFAEAPNISNHTDVHAGDYHLVGADLRQCKELRGKLDQCHLDPEAPTLFLAECVLVYMGSSQCHELLSELANWFPNSFFVNYEQVNISDSFGKVMIANLEQRGIMLPGLEACETLDAQKLRFLSSNWKHIAINTMKEIYENKLPSAEIQRIEKLEFLDEKILLSQLLEHYCFSLASRKGDQLDLDWSQFD